VTEKNQCVAMLRGSFPS